MHRVKLGDVAEIKLGKMLDAKKNKGELHPYLANINVRWGSFDLDNVSLMPFEASEAERFSVLPGDLMMCEGGEPGRCAVWDLPDTEMRYQKAVHRIRCSEALNPYWLYYWFFLAGKDGKLDKLFTPTTIKHLVREDLAAMEFDLPARTQQDAIVSAIKPIDDKIALNKKLCAELEKTAQLIYDYWFTQFDFPDENGNPYRSSGGKMVYNDILKREIPKGWRVERLGAICDIRLGGTPDTSVAEYWGEGVPWLSSAEIAYSPIIRAKKSVTDLGIENSATSFAPSGSVLLSITVPPKEVLEIYYSQVASLYAEISHTARESDGLGVLFDRLLPMLMNGQIGISADGEMKLLD